MLAAPARGGGGVVRTSAGRATILSTDRPSMTPRLSRALIVCALLAGLLLLVWMVRALVPAKAAPNIAVPTDEVPRATAAPVQVVLASATEMADTVELDLVGSGLAARSVTLFPAAVGEVAELNFRAGQRVRAEQVLLRLDPRTQKLAVDLAAARLEAAQRLNARYEATRGTGAVPGSVIDEAQSGVRLAQIALRQAEEALADRVLRAPFAGVVGLAQVEPGDRVSLDTAITTLDDRRTLQVVFDVPEAYAARLQTGHSLTVGNPAFGGRRFDGRIAQIDSRVDAASRNLRVRAAVPNRDDVLRPGMSFQVRLTLPGQTFAAVPELALQWGRAGAYVWVVRDEKAVPVPVRSVRRVDAKVLVDGALRSGEPVVVEGVQRLRAGRAVVPVEQPDVLRPPVSGPSGASAARPAPAAR